MNFTYTFLDHLFPEGYYSYIPKEYVANLSAEKAIYDALLDDEDFRREAQVLYSNKDTEKLSNMLKNVLNNEAKRQLSDMLVKEYSNKSNFKDAGHNGLFFLSAALDMCDSGSIDLVHAYKNAASTFELVIGLYNELRRKDKQHEKSRDR